MPGRVLRPGTKHYVKQSKLVNRDIPERDVSLLLRLLRCRRYTRREYSAVSARIERAQDPDLGLDIVNVSATVSCPSCGEEPCGARTELIEIQNRSEVLL